MGRKRFPVALAVAAVAMVALALATAADAAIIVVSQAEGFLGSDKTKVATAHNGTTEVSYNATGIDKLVVAIGTESGFNNQKVNTIGVTFNGVPLTLAVQENFAPPGSSPFTNDGGIAAILYLDNPFQGAANFSVSATTTGGGLNGGHVSIIGLAGTAGGVGNTGATWTSLAAAGNVSTSITTSASQSVVIAMVENSGANNGAGTPGVVSPLTLSNNGSWGSNWGGAASGYQFVPASGTTITPTFSTNAGGSIHTVAAEFAPAAAYAADRYWDGPNTSGTGNGASDGGNGTWDTSTLNWDPGAGQPRVAWNNSNNDTAVFAGTAGTVTLSTGITVGGLTLNTGGYTFSGSALSIADGGVVSGAGSNTATQIPNLALSPGNTTYRFAATNANSGFSNNNKFTVGTSTVLSGAGNSLVVSGTQMVDFGNTTNVTYGGATTVESGAALRYDGSLSAIGGGSGRNITVATGGSIVRSAGSVNNAFLNRLVENSNAFTIYMGNASNANNLDFSNGGAGAYLPNASLAFYDSVGTQRFAYTGTITPADNTYRFGGSRAGNYINLPNANTLTGPNSLVVIPGSTSKLRILAANDFSGDTLINSGTLYITHNLALQNSAIDTSGAGVIDVSGAKHSDFGSTTPVTTPTFGGLKGSKDIVSVFNSTYSIVTSITLNPGTGVTNSYSGVIADGAPGMTLTKTGLGTQVLAGANTYTGGTTIQAGAGPLVATVNTAQTALGTGGVSIGAGSTLQINDTSTSGSTTISNAFTGTGLLKLNFAAGTTARNTYMPNVTGFTGTIELSNAGTTGDKWNAANLGTIPGSLVIDSGSQLYVSGGTTSFSGGITVSGAGNSENRGAMRLGGTVGGNVTLLGDTTLGTEGGRLTGNIVSGAAGTQTLTLGGASDSGGNLTLSGNIGGGVGTIAISKVGSGTSYLTGTSTYTGETIFGGGIINVASVSDYGVPSAIGARAAADENTSTTGIGLHFRGGTLQYTGSTPQSTNREIRMLNGNGATINASGSVPAATLSFTHSGVNINLFDTAGTRTLTLTGTNTGDNSFSISLTNQGTNATSLTKSGTGTWVLNPVNGANGSTYTGTTTVSAGELRLASDTALGSTAGGTTIQGNVGGSGVVTLTNNITIGETFTLEGRQAATADIPALSNRNGSNTVTAPVLGTTGGNQYNIESQAGNLTLSGGFRQSSGTGDRYWKLMGSGAGDVTGPIEDGTARLNLIKTGTGTWTLSAVNTYSGPTTVNAGTLRVNGSITSPVTVNAGTLGGSGTIHGAVAVGDTANPIDAYLAPGNSPGILYVAGDLTMNSDSALVAEIDGTTPGLDPNGYDQVDVTGTVTLNSPQLELNFGFAPSLGDQFVLINNDSTDLVQGAFAGLPEGAALYDTTFGYQPFVITYRGLTGNDVVLTAVPEPSTWVLSAIGLLVLGWYCRWGRK